MSTTRLDSGNLGLNPNLGFVFYIKNVFIFANMELHVQLVKYIHGNETSKPKNKFTAIN